MKRKLFLFAVVFVLAISAFTQAKPEIKMGVGPSAGKEIRDLFIKIYADAGYSLVLLELPTARLAYSVEHGDIDCLIFTAGTTIARRPRCASRQIRLGG